MHLFTRRAIIFLCLFLSVKGYSATIKGHIYDKNTREQVVGGAVSIKSLNKGTVTELDGSFSFKDLAPGKYGLTFSYLGYVSIDSTVTITDNNQVIKLEIFLGAETHVMEQVQIKGKAYGGSDEFALRAEQKSISQVNIMSANAMQISPDITVANVMQRVSGVTMDRGASGEAQYAVIRGMEKKYNTTLVNGVKVPSPNDRDRYVPLDIFPAEMLERLEVNKTLMPNMEGDATGGTVNMVMKSAPNKLMVEGNIGGGYSTIFQNRDFMTFNHDVQLKSPYEKLPAGANASLTDFPESNLYTHKLNTPLNSTASVTLGNRFLNNRLGVLVAGSFQNTMRGQDSKSLVENTTLAPSTGKDVPLIQTFSDILVRQYSTKSDRAGVEAKLDYDLNEKNTISLFATYITLNEYRVRSTIDSALGNYPIKGGFIGPISLAENTETRQSLDNIYNATLQGKHKSFINNLDADWSLVASEAKRQLPDIASFATIQNVTPDRANETFSVGPLLVDNQHREWQHNSDADLSGYLNFHYHSSLIPGLSKIDFGAMYRTKHRDNFDNEYNLKPVVTDPTAQDQPYKSIDSSKFAFTPANGAQGTALSNAGVYTFDEKILAYYLQLHDEIGKKIKLDGGVRIENTDQSYMSSLPPAIQGKSAEFIYTDLLPSIQGKYELTDKSAVRVSYFRSIYRPAFSDLIPADDTHADENYTVQGNFNLKHTVIDNYDARYEFFSRGLDQILAGVFYKSIQNPIEYGLVQVGHTSDQVLEPQNFGNAHNYGLELVYRHYIGSFGVSFNYTYTKSLIKTDKRLYYTDSVTHITRNDTTSVSRPLQGQADHIGNFSLLYKNTKNKIDAQLSFVYTGSRIRLLNAYKGLDNYVMPMLTMDFSAQKQFGKHFIVYFKANNLLNTPYRIIIKQHNYAYSGTNRLPFQDSGNYVTVENDVTYSTFLIGMRFKF